MAKNIDLDSVYDFIYRARQALRIAQNMAAVTTGKEPMVQGSFLEEAVEKVEWLLNEYSKWRHAVPAPKVVVVQGRQHSEEAPMPEETPLAPIPMRLRCPACGTLHIDKDEFATKPHHTHACQKCGEVWRPAIVPTVGVQFLPGFKNET